MPGRRRGTGEAADPVVQGQSAFGAKLQDHRRQAELFGAGPDETLWLIAAARTAYLVPGDPVGAGQSPGHHRRSPMGNTAVEHIIHRVEDDLAQGSDTAV